jgi:hypothetical protein
MTPQQLDRLLLKTSRRYAGLIAREKNRYIRATADFYLRTGSIHSSDGFERHKRNIKSIWEEMVQRSIPLFGKETVIKKRRTKKSISFMQYKAYAIDKNENLFWDLMFHNYAQSFGGVRVTEIAETTRKDIQDAIVDYYVDPEKGISAQQVAKKISSTTKLSPFRASTIALTEIGLASSYATQTTAEKISDEFQLGNVTKTWVAVEDNRTREAHKEADGQTVGLYEKFTVDGEELDRPRDPFGSAENVIRCRCQVTYSSDAEEDISEDDIPEEDF